MGQILQCGGGLQRWWWQNLTEQWRAPDPAREYMDDNSHPHRPSLPSRATSRAAGCVTAVSPLTASRCRHRPTEFFLDSSPSFTYGLCKPIRYYPALFGTVKLGLDACAWVISGYPPQWLAAPEDAPQVFTCHRTHDSFVLSPRGTVPLTPLIHHHLRQKKPNPSAVVAGLSVSRSRAHRHSSGRV